MLMVPPQLVLLLAPLMLLTLLLAMPPDYPSALESSPRKANSLQGPWPLPHRASRVDIDQSSNRAKNQFEVPFDSNPQFHSVNGCE